MSEAIEACLSFLEELRDDAAVGLPTRVVAGSIYRQLLAAVMAGEEWS